MVAHACPGKSNESVSNTTDRKLLADPAWTSFRLVALALVCGGAVGNLVDRIRSAQGVVDFVDIGLGSWRWPTFNVADSAITIGAIALGLSLWQEGRAQHRAKEARAAEP